MDTTLVIICCWLNLTPDSPSFRYRAMSEVVSQASKAAAANGDGEANGDAAQSAADSPRGRGRAPPVLPSLLWDLTRAQLLEPSLAEDLVQFSLLSVGTGPPAGL